MMRRCIFAWAVAALACSAVVVRAHCPHQCSGHGTCGTSDVCTCYSGWANYDCSQRSCATGNAWFDEATATDTAHASGAECSAMGDCNRATGQCACRDGFSGIACERMDCPNDCSGHGQCMSMAKAASTKDDQNLLVSTTYALWDAEKIQGCVCDPEYEGYDCSRRKCPTGDDPLTTGQNDEVQTIACGCTSCSGTMVLSFRGQTTAPIAWDAVMQATDETSGSNTAGIGEGESVQSKLQALKTIDGVTVTVSGGSGTSRLCQGTAPTVSITFTRQHGNVPTLTAESSLSGTPTPTLVIATTTTGDREEAECSNRGICDRATGICQCYDGYSSSDGTNSITAGNTGDCSYYSVAPTTCPGDEACSGHGTCAGGTFVCTCWDGYTGPACAERSCPEGRSWWDEATAANTAHALAECSAWGYCNRATGVCECSNPMEGSACDRLACPTSDSGDVCNGLGRCLSMQDAAKERTVNGEVIGNLEVQSLTCTATSGTITFTHEYETTVPSISYAATAAQVKTALEGLASIGLVTVTFSTGSAACSGAGVTISITFDNQLGNQNAITGTSSTGSFSATTEVTAGSRVTYGATPGTESVWDFKSVYGCVCDDRGFHNTSYSTGDIREYVGYQCTKRTCPTGHDPQDSTTTYWEKQTITCSATSGTFTVTFRGVTSSAIAYNADQATVDAALEAMKTMGVVTTTLGDGASGPPCGAGGKTTVVEFQTKMGDLPAMTCTASSSEACTVAETTAGTKQNAECAKRGICDETSGLCKCFTSYRSSDGSGNEGTRGDCGFIDHLFIE